VRTCGATWPKDPTLVCVRESGHRGGHSYDIDWERESRACHDYIAHLAAAGEALLKAAQAAGLAFDAPEAEAMRHEMSLATIGVLSRPHVEQAQSPPIVSPEED
jgi:hypothetical protein